nr:DUF6444 domain-containing protein [Saccharopolyspora pogona]
MVARVEVLEAENAELRADNAKLRTENTALKRKLGVDSTNSSTPSSQDSLASKGKRRAQRSQRVRSKDRKRGGQPGHKGSGLTPAVTPDRAETASAPEDCSGCGADLADGRDAGTSWTQIWDIPSIRLEKAHYVLPRRQCACCGKITTAVVPFGHQKVSGYWHTLTTLARFCRVRSYLTSAINHGHRAIHPALTGNTWMPPTTA